MSRLELVTECEVCDGKSLAGHIRPKAGSPSNFEAIYEDCPGSGGSRIPLDPDRKIVVLHRWRQLTVQDVLDALGIDSEDTE